MEPTGHANQGASQSLASLSSSARDVPWLFGLAALLLVAGDTMDVVTIEYIVRDTGHYSVMGGVRDLWLGGNIVLAAILFSFSVVFPWIKLVALAWLWLRPLKSAQRDRWCRRLKTLGKWSLLDTFVVVLLVGCLQLSALVSVVHASAQPGVYAFAAAIFVSLALAFRLARLAGRGAPEENRPGVLGWPVVCAAWGAAGCLVTALCMPILQVEKRGLSHTYSLPRGTLDLAQAGGEWCLASGVLVFVVLLPLVWLVGLGACAFQSCRGKKMSGLTLLSALEHWTMVDVFALGLWLVFTKVGGIADATPLVGFWFMIVAGGLSVLCAWRVRRIA
ncbi:MAG: paraquat-inducible protein A [bacterium]|jgi:paraquat-inducible protein A|nr:hypothetical protein [Planctomycetota bacterium]HIL50741.1 hypothetical protein [Planctomycetota bacterium]